MAEQSTNFIGETAETVEIRRWLVCPTGNFTNPAVGTPSIRFPLAIRRKIDGDAPTDINTGKLLSLSLSDPPQLIPFIDPATFQQFPLRDVNGNLIEGNYFNAMTALLILQSLFAYAVNEEMQAGTILEGVNQSSLGDLSKVVQNLEAQA